MDTLFHKFRRKGVNHTAKVIVASIGLLLIAPAQTDDTVQQPNSTSTAMYFHSQVADAAECADAMTVKKGKIVFSADIPNPAIACPDAFGWKQFLEAIDAKFWRNWANDETVWVTEPKPLCADKNDTDCCFVNPKGKHQVGYRNTEGRVEKPGHIGGPGQYCPYIPGDWGGANMTEFKNAKTVTSHNTTFLLTRDPARIARQREVEIVYRNDPFVRFTTENELYSKAGLAKVFARIAGEAQNSIPFRPNGQGVSYSMDSVMFKADWIPQKTMLELGYVTDHDKDPSTPPQDPENPYITMQIETPAKDGKYKKGMYYLAAITGASKALPNWHWYAFEHVNNLGRCDYTGCNDSYGFLTEYTIFSPQGDQKTQVFNSNFIAPHTESDQLDDDTDLFDLAKRYPSGTMTPGLARAFKKMKIGTKANDNPDFPSTKDKGWRSYRLKGTQTQYYNRDGYTTRVGASITEGGFVNTASCMSCHVQASVNAKGELGVPGVGATGRLNLSGIGTVIDGAPHASDYYDRGTSNQRAVQIDFVWGILFAN